MRKRLGAIAFVVLMIAFSAQLADATVNPNDPLLERAMGLLSRIQNLQEKNVNVTGLVHKLNESVWLIQEGKRDEASHLLDQLEENVTRLEGVADSIHLKHLAVFYAKVGVLLSIPVIFYYGFPRLYLYYWFRSRRRWEVRGST